MTLPKPPAPFLPDWARVFFDGRRTTDPNRPQHVLIDDEMPHRREAFYRLFCTADAGMRDFWVYAANRLQEACQEKRLDVNKEQFVFLERLILATDNAIEPERYWFDPMPPREQQQRLRDPLQSLARKVACQVRELSTIQPHRRISGATLMNPWSGPLIEALVIYYDFGMPGADYYGRRGIFRKNDIEYTSSSKRGWIQHAQAADRLRPKVIANLRRLAEESSRAAPVRPRQEFLDSLRDCADRLAALPNLADLAVGEPELESQKSSWADWLRSIIAWYSEAGEVGNFLRHRDWATLTYVLFDVQVTEDRIGDVISLS